MIFPSKPNFGLRQLRPARRRLTNPPVTERSLFEANVIQQARGLPNLEFFEFQCLSDALDTESNVSFSLRASDRAANRMSKHVNTGY